MIDGSRAYLTRVVVSALDSPAGRQVNDMYKDLRERLPCYTACWLLWQALQDSRAQPLMPGQVNYWVRLGCRARKLAALKRLGAAAERKCQAFWAGRAASLRAPAWAEGQW